MNWINIFFTSKYAVEIFIGAILFSLPYKRKKRYLLWLLLPFTLVALGVLATSFLSYSNQFYNFVRFLTVNILLCIGMLFCYSSKPSNIIFSCTAAMAVQQFSAGLLSLIRLGFSFNIVKNNVYITSTLNEIITFTPIYIIFYYLFARRVTSKGYNDADNFKMKIMSAVIVLVCIGIYRFTDSKTTNGIIVGALYSMTCCVFALVIQFALHEQIALRQNLVLEKELHRQDKKHYENWRDSVEIINIKYHDLKHQIARLRSSKDDNDWEELEHALAAYDNMVKTGNDVFDIIIAEKKMLGDKYGISMTCMADGSALAFLRESDLYSLLGNALDNAVNAVKEVDEISKRNISVIVRRVGVAVIIHIENYFQGEIMFKSGIPQTSGDKNFHGYGLKSIKMIVDKYNGTLNATANNNIFCLDIILQPNSDNAN